MTGNAQESALAAEMRRQQFSALLKLSPQAIVVLDTDGRVREWNPAAVDLLGWPREDALGRPLPELSGTAGRAGLESLWAQLRATRQAGTVLSSHLHRGGPGSPVEVYMAPIQDHDGSFAGVVATLSRQPDLTGAAAPGGRHPSVLRALPEQRWEAELPALGPLDLDDVTGLPGRRWLQQRMTEALPAGEERAVAVLDVDAFALVNQAYGDEAGDAVLRELAARLARVSGSAAVGHWQADEFVCILDGVGAEDALEALVAQMAPAAREPFELAGEAVRLSISVGMASSAGVPLPALFRSASAAMAQAKSRGRDCAVWFDRATSATAGGSGLRLANDLHEGLRQGQMRLHFQPIVELATNDVDGVEALLRWERPGVGLLAPGAFIEIAERTGQIVPLGEWVIGQACQAAVDFDAAGFPHVRVSINVSARQLSDSGLVGMLSAALTRTGCPPERIAIEVTETAVLRDIAAATAVLETIKGLGVDLDLDDFGTGYSSLLYLRHFPVDRIKIDQSFVSGLGTSIADTAIVASTIALAHSVGLRAVAEGVETSQQLTMLRQMRCDFAQGYLLCHPLPADLLVLWWQQQLPSRLLARGTEPVRSGGSTSRDSAADQRDHVSDQRDDVADERDEIADQRDLLADERDLRAGRRDDAASEQLRGLGQPTTDDAAVRQEVLGGFATARQEAAADRTLASQDRSSGVEDRLQAERDRGHASADRGVDADRTASAPDRQLASVDALTGGYLREAGLVAIAAAMASAHRDLQPLTLVAVAVGPRATGQQAEGQLGADARMVMVANALGVCLREGDVLVRDGEDHFLCALPGLTPTAAAARLAPVHSELAGPPRLVGVRLGHAELRPDDCAERLVARAHEALLRG